MLTPTSDRQAFTRFMQAYQDMVFSTAARLLGNPAQAEDIAQEVFMRAYQQFEQLRDSDTAGGWLKTVATRLSLNHLTRHRRRWRLFSELRNNDHEDDSDAEPMEPATLSDALLKELESEQRQQLFEQALRRLPDHQRVPLVLYHFEAMSYQDIARQLHASLAKIKVDILRGRLALARQLTEFKS